MKKLKLGGLFEGIGGFPLAAQWAGIEPIWSNEIDHWCCKVLRKNFDHEIIEKDIRKISAYPTSKGFQVRASEKMGQSKEVQKLERLCGKTFVKRPDILTGGFPCQPFSHAGKRKGKDDNRNFWPEFIRLIRELQPAWIIAENVAGLISMENGRTLEGILNDLENENYTPEIYNIPACGVGAWHKRERIWIVAHNANTRIKSMQERKNAISENAPIANSKTTERKQSGNTRTGGGGLANSCEDVSDTISRGQQGQGQFIKSINSKEDCKRETTKLINGSQQGIWEFEPNVGRVANGIPGRVDRLKGLGNAIVPQVAYELFKAILEYEQNYLNEEDYK